MAKEKQYVFLFKNACGLGKNLLGGKGNGLAEMTHAGVPIPPGFTITTEACTLYYDNGKKMPSWLFKQIDDGVKEIEKQTGKTFGGSNGKPLLVSVRSGARVSMPGMMDTILNLGLNDVTVEELAKVSNNERFAYDSYRRFILMFTNIAKGYPRTEMDAMLDKIKKDNGYKLDTEVTSDQLKVLVKEYKKYYKEHFGEEFPTDPLTQLHEAVTAVFRSWDNPRANVYRAMNGIPYEWGTAVNVQTMVFGNLGETSGTGVAFSRDPGTGEKKVYAEFLPNAQGEDVVAVRTPLHIDELKTRMPDVYKQFMETIQRMENYFHDMQDMEYTIENGKLYFLQTRNGKRTAASAVKIACDLVDEGLIDEKEACLRVEPKQLNDLLHPTFDPADLKKQIAILHGLPASPGAGTGHLVFTAEEAKAEKDAGRPVVLVRAETSPEDIIGMVNAEAILTARGGMTSHAAVVARSMGKCCVAGATDAIVNEEKKTLTINGKDYNKKDVLSVNGSTGDVYLGAVKMVPASLSGDFGRIMGWADKFRRLAIRANCNSPLDAENAAKFGSEGIGLCRTERMFFGVDRILNMRSMILSDTTEQRVAALERLRPYQVEDFYEMYMSCPKDNVCIRLLDPPLHEFLPDIHDEENIKEMAEKLNVSIQKVKDRINQLHQANPMMGFRGVRLCVAYPEIYRMQATAIIQAALKASKDLGHDVEPEIMIPLTGELKELTYAKQVVIEAVEGEMKKEGHTLKYHIGTMIEIPRGALQAGNLAKDAEFFSFGTHDLTQLTMGFSRDDAGQFLPYYYDKKIYEFDPFQTVDQEGVGELVKIAVERGRATRKDILIGVCGETGGDPASIEFYDRVGLDYVSCSPFRVPLARLAAAQSEILVEREKKAAKKAA